MALDEGRLAPRSVVVAAWRRPWAQCAVQEVRSVAGLVRGRVGGGCGGVACRRVGVWCSRRWAIRIWARWVGRVEEPTARDSPFGIHGEAVQALRSHVNPDVHRLSIDHARLPASRSRRSRAADRATVGSSPVAPALCTSHFRPDGDLVVGHGRSGLLTARRASRALASWIEGWMPFCS